MPVAKPIKAVLALFPVLHQTRAFQLREVGRNAALPHRQDFLKFGDRQFLPFQQQQKPQPARIGDQFQGLENRCHLCYCRTWCTNYINIF